MEAEFPAARVPGRVHAVSKIANATQARSNLGRSASFMLACYYFATRARMSTATTPSGKQCTGLISSSAISG